MKKNIRYRGMFISHYVGIANNINQDYDFIMEDYFKNLKKKINFQSF